MHQRNYVQSHKMKGKRVKKNALFLLVISVMFSGCDKQEKLLDEAYFQTLGADKTFEYVSNCVAEKSALLDKKDAAGADAFSKSVHAQNCYTAFKYGTGEDAKRMQAASKKFLTASSEDEIKKIETAIAEEVSSKWQITKAPFPEWEKARIALSFAFASLDRSAVAASGRLSRQALINYGK